jgi:hypothetical protein
LSGLNDGDAVVLDPNTQERYAVSDTAQHEERARQAKSGRNHRACLQQNYSGVAKLIRR